MTRSIRTRVILVQLTILAALVVWFKVYLPRLQRARAVAQVAEREERIVAALASLVTEDESREIEISAAAGGGRRHPQKLRRLPSVDDVQQALGAPDVQTADFRSGQHLTWIGARHKLEAAFDKGRLYNLRIADRQTGHGTLVYETSAYWQAF